MASELLTVSERGLSHCATKDMSNKTVIYVETYAGSATPRTITHVKLATYFKSILTKKWFVSVPPALVACTIASAER
jgi:hypothetical protein